MTRKERVSAAKLTRVNSTNNARLLGVTALKVQRRL